MSHLYHTCLQGGVLRLLNNGTCLRIQSQQTFTERFLEGTVKHLQPKGAAICVVAQHLGEALHSRPPRRVTLAASGSFQDSSSLHMQVKLLTYCKTLAGAVCTSRLLEPALTEQQAGRGRETWCRAQPGMVRQMAACAIPGWSASLQ